MRIDPRSAFIVNMDLRPVLVPINAPENLPPPARVARQRSAARAALEACARACSIRNQDWPQTPDRVPLSANGYHWSISHKPMLAGAVISDAPVGIDIEHLRPRGSERLWDRLADAEEWSAAGRRDWLMFFRLWTAKEATLKANSRGIGGLEECRVVDVPDETHLILSFGGREWKVEHYRYGTHIVSVTADERRVHWTLPPAAESDP